MGRKRKLEHFAENKTFPHFFEPSYNELQEGYNLKGNWRKGFFQNENPVIIELGCGKGEYTVGLAQRYPDKNFIGIDRKGARMWRGAKTSLDENLKNVAFLRTRIELINLIFGQHEVNEIWITFPDPQPKDKNEKRRLTSSRFLKLYKQILVPPGLIHLKTDSDLLYKYTRNLIREQDMKEVFQTNDLYNSSWNGDAIAFQTYYEQKFYLNGIRIKYLKFNLESSKNG